MSNPGSAHASALPIAVWPEKGRGVDEITAATAAWEEAASIPAYPANDPWALVAAIQRSQL